MVHFKLPLQVLPNLQPVGALVVKNINDIQT